MNAAAIDDLVSRLKDLGKVRERWSADAHVYFDHSGGRVSLHQASAFFDHAVGLAQEAAGVLTAALDRR